MYRSDILKELGQEKKVFGDPWREVTCLNGTMGSRLGFFFSFRPMFLLFTLDLKSLILLTS